jgi:hypothetical protein
MSNNLSYAEAERAFVALIMDKAKRWAARGIGEADDLFQEGRIHAHRCWLTYDQSRSGARGLTTYVGFVLDNEYKNMADAAMAQKRVPRIWTQDAQTGEWAKMPSKPISIDAPMGEEGMTIITNIPATGEQGCTPEQWTGYLQEDSEVRAILIILMSRLKKRQRKVLRAMANPDWGMYAMVRNLTGSSTVFKVTKRHIAMYLGLTYGQVENDAAAIRRAARTLLAERGCDVQ